MSYESFRRNVQVQIIDRKDKVPISISSGANALVIPEDPFNEKLKIDFNISLKSNSNSGASYIELFNLNDETQSFIKNINAEVKVLAGYGETLSVIFDGNVTKVEVTRKNNNMVTRIELGTQLDILTAAYFSKTYKGRTKVKSIITDAIKTFSMPPQFLNVIPDKTVENFSWAGRTKDLMDSLLTPIEISWHHHLNAIRFSKKGIANNTNNIFIVTPENGLLDFPIKTDKGTIINMLFNAEIALNEFVEIQMDAASLSLDGRKTNLFIQELNGKYKVVDAVHKGSSYGGNMMTILDTVAL